MLQFIKNTFPILSTQIDVFSNHMHSLASFIYFINRNMNDLLSETGGSPKRTYKIVLLGDSKVGKTSIINRFTANKIDTQEISTVGVDFVGKNVVHNGKTHRLQLWDTSGNERYRSLIPNYLKDVACALFVFDHTDGRSLENLENWIKLLHQHQGEKVIIWLCENKVDLPIPENKNNSRDTNTSKNQAEEAKFAPNMATLKFLKNKHKIENYPISAYTGKNIHSMFHDIIDQINKQRGEEKKNTVFFPKSDPQDFPASTQNFVIEDMEERNISVTAKSSSNLSDYSSGSGRKRRRKVERLKPIESITTETFKGNKEQQSNPRASIWNKLCPCCFK